MNDEERKFWTNVRDNDVYEHQYVIEVKANELVGSGDYRTPRHPQYVVRREDKLPETCTMEQFRVER